MAPTIQTGHPLNRDKSLRAVDRKSELVCRVKYCNTLPDIPFDPKFITYPFESNRFVQYNPTSLERNYKHDLLTEHDLGVTIDLINPETYAVDPEVLLDAPDERLLEEELTPQQDSKRSQHHAKRVSWLRRTEYISTEYTRFQPSSDKTETKVGYNVKKFFKQQDLYMDRESQIKAIDKTFEDAKVMVDKHYSKPGVTPVEVLSVFPDFELWRYPCAQVIFDSDPAPANRPLPAQLEEMSQAMIRGVMDESGEQFVAYFLPSEDTMRKRKRDSDEGVDYQDDEEYDYKMAREYNWNVKNKASKGYEENYFCVFRENGVFYNELETKVRLSKRRVKAGVAPNNSRLVVRHRPLNEQEFKIQEVRMMQLEPPQEEEEEEEEQVEMEVEKNEEEKDEEEEEKDEEEEKEADEEEEEDEDKDENEEKENSESDEEHSEKPESEDEKSEKEESGSEKADSDNEKEEEQEGEASDKEASDKEASDKEASDKEASDKEASDKEASDKEEEEEEDHSSAKSASSPAASSSAEEGSAKSSSESESEADEEQKRRDEEEIFGSGSDSD